MRNENPFIELILDSEDESVVHTKENCTRVFVDVNSIAAVKESYDEYKKERVCHLLLKPYGDDTSTEEVKCHNSYEEVIKKINNIYGPLETDLRRAVIRLRETQKNYMANRHNPAIKEVYGQKVAEAAEKVDYILGPGD